MTCSVRPPGPVRTDADFSILVEHGPEALATADTVVVPASYERGPLFEEGRLPDDLAAAFALVRPGTRMVSICTGSYVLAAAGYLDGRPATRTGRRPTTSSGRSRRSGWTRTSCSSTTATC